MMKKNNEEEEIERKRLMRNARSAKSKALKKVGQRPADLNIGKVYFIREPGTDFVKIGFTTNNLEARLLQIQNGNPVTLEIEHVIHDQFLKTETELHRYFRSAHIRGEWFLISKEELRVFLKTEIANFTHI